MCCCTPPGTSHEYGQTIPIFMARAPRDAGTVRPAARPRAGVQVGGEHPLQHVPVLRVLGDRLARTPAASCWLIAATFSRAGARLGHRDLRRRCARPSRLPRTRSRSGISAAPVCTASAAVRGDPRLLPEHLDLDPALLQVAVADQADQAAGPQPLGQGAERAASAGQREHLEPQALPEPHEALVDRLGPSRSATVVNCARPAGDDPGAGLLEVAHVRQRDDHAPAGLQAARTAPPRPGPGSASRSRAARWGSPAAGTPPASTWRRSCSAARDSARSSLPSTSAVPCSSSAPGAGWPRAPGPSAPAGARRCRPRSVKTHRAHDCGTRQISFQPSWYATPRQPLAQPTDSCYAPRRVPFLSHPDPRRQSHPDLRDPSLPYVPRAPAARK